jgi:hypothetical protein
VSALDLLSVIQTMLSDRSEARSVFTNGNCLRSHGILVAMSALLKTRRVNQNKDNDFFSGHGTECHGAYFALRRL